MYTAEISNRTDLLKAAALLAVAAAFATLMTIQVFAMVISRIQLNDQRDTLFETAALLDDASMLHHGVVADDLHSMGDRELRTMLDNSLTYLTSLPAPKRASFEIEAALSAAADTAGIIEATGLALANELNATLLYEDLQSRIETIVSERNRRATIS